MFCDEIAFFNIDIMTIIVSFGISEYQYIWIKENDNKLE